MTRRLSALRIVAILCAAAFGCGEDSTTTSPTSSPPPTPTPAPAPTTRVMSLSGTLAFGSVPVGQSATAPFTITNTGDGPLTVSGLSISAGLSEAYAADWTAGTIQPGSAQDVTIRFDPKDVRSYIGTLVVNGNHTSGTNRIDISGTGTPPFKLSGTVRDGQSGQPVSSAKISAVRQGGGGASPPDTTSDAAGHYSMGVLPGPFAVYIRATGYDLAERRITVSGDTRFDLVIARTAPNAQYHISGSAKTCAATYRNSSGGTNQQVVTIPFDYSWNGATRGDFLYMSCQISGGDNGSITVQVYRAGGVCQSASASGAGSIATASCVY